MDVERASQVIVAQAPRRLRLDELLRELGARTSAAGDPVGPAAGTSTTGDPVGPTETPAPEHEAVRAESLTVGELVDKAAEAGFGFLIGVLTLIAIPFFGLSTPFGSRSRCSARSSRSACAGRGYRSARRRTLSMAMLDRVLGILARRTKWLSKSTKRRWETLITPRLVGLGVVLLALGLALPLPIPGSNMVFLIPIFIYAIGLLERDGVWIALGHLGTVIDMTLLVIFGATVIAVLARCWHWLF